MCVTQMLALRNADTGEVLCAFGAACFVTAGCWMGWAVAINGVLAHGTQGWCRCSDCMVWFDVVCNAGFTIVMVTDGVLYPYTSVLLAIVLLGMFAARKLALAYPLGARIVHVIAVQLPSFVAISAWCRCCGPNAAHG